MKGGNEEFLHLDKLRRASQVNTYLGGLPQARSLWLLRVLEEIRVGRIPVLRSLLDPEHLKYAEADAFRMIISVSGRQGVVLQIRRTST